MQQPDFDVSAAALAESRRAVGANLRESGARAREVGREASLLLTRRCTSVSFCGEVGLQSIPSVT